MEQKLSIFTDGSCAGNPGLLGIGGVIEDKNSKDILYTFSMSKGIGLNNEAEYLAVIHALENVIELKLQPDSIFIYSDSHLMIYQLTGENRVEQEGLLNLHKKVKTLVEVLDCSVKYVWIPREKNVAANALARKGANMPMAIIHGNVVKEWKEELSHNIDEETLKKLPEVNPETSFQIDYLNFTPDVSLSKVFSLISFGLDKYSRAKQSDLLNYIEIRFGSSTKEYLARTLVDLQDSYSKNVLRWVARGLKPNIAFIKACMEVEIKDNSGV